MRHYRINPKLSEEQIQEAERCPHFNNGYCTASELPEENLEGTCRERCHDRCCKICCNVCNRFWSMNNMDKVIFLGYSKGRPF